jgi:multidrug resistance efflux pump
MTFNEFLDAAKTAKAEYENAVDRVDALEAELAAARAAVRLTQSNDAAELRYALDQLVRLGVVS